MINGLARALGRLAGGDYGVAEDGHRRVRPGGELGLPELGARIAVEGVQRAIERRREEDAVGEGRGAVGRGRELVVPRDLARGLVHRDDVPRAAAGVPELRRLEPAVVGRVVGGEVVDRRIDVLAVGRELGLDATQDARLDVTGASASTVAVQGGEVVVVVAVVDADLLSSRAACRSPGRPRPRCRPCRRR